MELRQARQALGDPLEGGHLERGVCRGRQYLQFSTKCVDLVLRLLQRLGERPCALALADEGNVVHDSPLLSGESGSGELDLLGKVRVKAFHLQRDPFKHVVHRRRVRYLLRDLGKDSLLEEPTRHEQLVRARTLRSAQAAVIAAGLATDLSHRSAACATSEQSREQVWRVGLHVASLLTLEAAVATALRPSPVDLLPAGDDSIPDFLRDDTHLLALHNVPLARRLNEPPLAAGARVAARLGPVPKPPADVLFALENAADCRRTPRTARCSPARNPFLI